MKVEVVDLGIETPGYFRGFGIIGTQFDECVVGCAISFKEAFENAIEQLGQQVPDVPVFLKLEELVRIEFRRNKLKNVDASSISDEEWYGEEDEEDDYDEATSLHNYIGIRFSLQ